MGFNLILFMKFVVYSKVLQTKTNLQKCILPSSLIHGQCWEPWKGQQKDPILKKTTVFCPSGSYYSIEESHITTADGRRLLSPTCRVYCRPLGIRPAQNFPRVWSNCWVPYFVHVYCLGMYVSPSPNPTLDMINAFLHLMSPLCYHLQYFWY